MLKKMQRTAKKHKEWQCAAAAPKPDTRVYLKASNALGQRDFLHSAAPFFLEIR